jgi:chemotaxis protein MotB
MPISSRRQRRPTIDIWPGFVDALAQLVMVFVFVLLIFTAGQFYLTDALSGRDAALARLTQQVNDLTDLLALERRNNSDLQLNLSQLSAQLAAVNRDRDALAARVGELSARADEATTKARGSADLQSALDKATQDLTIERKHSQDLSGQLTAAQQLSVAGQSTIDQLNQQLLALRQQLASIAAALEASEAKDRDQQLQITDLGKRLNMALASKVEELARFRSEFFGRLREILGDRPDIRIVGDRFVFQSEVLFAPGSADLSDDAKRQLAPVAQALKEIADKIPTDINWVLRVDGHTDKRPISTPQFPSNLELSTARAIAVVRFLIDQGIPANRLAAAGFGEHQPVDTRDTEDAYRHNRRIELKLTEG